MVHEGKEEYLESFIDISEAQDKGILKKIIKEGTEDACLCVGDTAVVHYVGTYFGGEQDGVKFDSSRDRGEHFTFAVSQGQVIKAWDACVPTMKIGEICELVATPDYCYMDGKAMKFEIEMFGVRGVDISPNNDGSVTKSVVSKGTGLTEPSAGSNVTIHICCKKNDVIFDERSVTYCVGDFADAKLPRGIDLAVRHMKVDEVVKVVMEGESLQDKNIPTDAIKDTKVVYNVTLKSLDKLKHLSSFSKFDEQYEYAEKVKDQANGYLKEGKYALAVEMYEKLSDEIQYVVSYGIAEKKKLTAITNAIHLNIALVHMKNNQPKLCMEKCKLVLESDSTNEKALFRMGQACVLNKDHEEALHYFKSVVEHYPNNSAAVAQVQLCEKTIKQAKEKERQIFRSVFTKLAETGFDVPASNGIAKNTDIPVSAEN